MNKRIGKIYEGRWRVESFIKYQKSHNGSYLLRNIYNGHEIILCYMTMRKIDAGGTSISAILCKKARIEKKGNWWARR